MIFADWHPDDERLLDRYLDPAGHDEACDRHLAACRRCRDRAASLHGLLERAHGAARSAADAAFDATRLDRQYMAVMARLGADIRGRLLAFPAEARTDRLALRLPRPLRSVAAAILLATIAGAGAARFLATSPDLDAARPARGLAAEPVRGMAIQSVSYADESVFSEIDVALIQPRTAELRALDDLTPHAYDAIAPVR